MQQLVDEWEDDSLITLLRVLCAGCVLRNANPVVADCVARVLGRAAKRLANPTTAAKYEQQLRQLQPNNQQSLLCTVLELQYLAMFFQYDVLTGSSSEAPNRKV